MRLKFLLGRPISCNQATTRAIANLANKRCTYSRTLSLIHLVPDLPVWITESRKRAQGFRIEQLHLGAVLNFRLPLERLSTGRFLAVESDFGVRAIAKRLRL